MTRPVSSRARRLGLALAVALGGTVVLGPANSAAQCNMCNFGGVPPTMPHDVGAFALMATSVGMTATAALSAMAFGKQRTWKWLGPTLALALNILQLAANGAFVAAFPHLEGKVIGVMFVPPALAAGFALTALILGLNLPDSEPWPEPIVNITNVGGSPAATLGVMFRL